MKSILYLLFLVTTASGVHAGCLTLLCPSPKTVSCTDTTWTFDTPGVSNCPGCLGNDLSITVLNTTPLAGPACSQQTTRTWFITNDCGSAECSQTVTVVNTNQPVFAGATNITVTSCGAVQVFFNPTAAETCCGNLPVTCSPPSGTYFPVGLATFVTCTATDCCSNTYSTQFYVHVIQEQGLNVTCIDKSVPCGTNWTFDPPVVNDTCCTGNYSFFPQPPITNGTGCAQTITEVWGVTDQCGNSNYCTESVYVTNSPPTTNSSSQCVIQVAAGYQASTFLTSDGSVWAMGANQYGQLGSGTPNSSACPDQIVTGSVTAIAEGLWDSLIIKSDGSLWDWGYNYFNELGNGNNLSVNIPKKLVDSGITAVAEGGYHSLFLKSGGSLWAMGFNGHGQLGDGTENDAAVPEQIVSNGVTAISAGLHHTLFLKNDGSLWAMGDNSFGQVGNGTYVDATTPQQIVPSGVTAISAGGYFSLFLKNDGSLWAMGDNSLGQFGNGTTVSVAQPEQILGISPVAISAGAYHSLFLNSDGSLWATGDNGNGQLGDGTFNNVETPEQIVPSGVTSVSGGFYYSLFIKNNGSLWGMGADSSGQLGDCAYSINPPYGTNQPEEIVTGCQTSSQTNGCITLSNLDNIALKSCAGIPVFYTPAAIDTCCTNLTVTCFPPSGSYFAPGTITTVICTASDACGNILTTNFTVTLQCCTNLVIVCPPPKFVQCGSAWTFDPPAVYDTCCSNYLLFPLNPVTNGNGCAQTITEVWSAFDQCGNSNYCAETVYVTNGSPSLILPVYQVSPTAVTPAQFTNLAGSLNIPSGALAQSNGFLYFVDSFNYMLVPTVPVTNATVISNLLAVTKNPYPAIPISFQAPDFVALSNLSVMDSNTALVSAQSALAASGLTPLFGSPVIGHTTLTAFCTNSDNSVSSASQFLDTQVDYQFTEPNGYPMVGPGAQVQVTYGAAGNVTRLLYAARQLAPGPSVQIISQTEASNRIAQLLPPNANINMQLVYWCPPFWPSTPPCSGCPSVPWNPPNIIPWYAFNATVMVTNPITGSNYSSLLEGQMIPATDDPNFVPSLSFAASAASGTQIVASVSVSGGVAPYTYSWSGSDPAVSSNGGPSIAYTPKVRIASPPLGIASSSSNTISISWPYPSTGFVLESSVDLASGAWTDVANPIDTNNGMNTVVLEMKPASPMFFRLGLAGQILVTEAVAVTVTDADGVWVQTNQTFTVQAEPITTIGGDPAYGTESPYDVGGWDSDTSGWLDAMGQNGGGSQAFLWTKFNSWPGDFAEPNPAGTLETVLPEGAVAPPLFADADFSNDGVDAANMVMYLGHGNWNVFTFTYPNYLPLNGSAAYGIALDYPGQDMSATYYDRLTPPPNGRILDYPFNLSGAWGDMGPNDYLKWLVFESCLVLQYNANDPTLLSSPNASGLYAWQRWGGAFNGLHIMLGYHTDAYYPEETPGIFANLMLTGTPVRSFFSFQLSPQRIADAWLAASEATQPPATAAAVMGPMGPFGVWDRYDYYPGKGSMGPSIPSSQITGWWYLTYQSGLQFSLPNH